MSPLKRRYFQVIPGLGLWDCSRQPPGVWPDSLLRHSMEHSILIVGGCKVLCRNIVPRSISFHQAGPRLHPQAASSPPTTRQVPATISSQRARSGEGNTAQPAASPGLTELLDTCVPCCCVIPQLACLSRMRQAAGFGRSARDWLSRYQPTTQG